MFIIQSIELGGLGPEGGNRFAVVTFGAGSHPLLRAKALCRTLGLSIGDRDRDNPIGLAWNGVAVRKWHTLSESEIDQLAGTLGATDFENGPIVMRLNRVPDDKVWNKLAALACPNAEHSDAWDGTGPTVDLSAPWAPPQRPPLEYSTAFLRSAESAYYALSRGDAEPARRLLCDALGRIA